MIFRWKSDCICITHALRSFPSSTRKRQENPIYLIFFIFFYNNYIRIIDFQILSKLESPKMAGEIAVMLNIPQPFTVRTRRLSQVVRISHHHFKQLVQPNNDDGKILFSNFTQVRKMVEDNPNKINKFYVRSLCDWR